jgi:hypothetical protein
MDDVVLAGWTRRRDAGSGADERGTTVVEYLMLLAMVLSAVVLVATLGASLAGDTI